MATDDRIDAFLALRSGGRLLVARERIRLLEAVIEHGSITAAAKATGFSYKTAWEAVDAINNLLPRPAFVTRAGGRVGGGAEVTAEGRKLIETFRRLEERLARISTTIAEDGLDGLDETVLWATGFRVSARNLFHAEVVAVRRWPVDVEVTSKISEEATIQAIVTNSAAEDLLLAPGRRVLALVKASFVGLVPIERAGEIRRNLFRGRIERRIDAEVNSEVVLAIGGGKTLVAVLPRREVEARGFEVGAEAAATFDPDHVILAVD
jgi:molybdate transport system regulatory protein